MSSDELVYVAFGDSITFAVDKFGVTEETAFRSIVARELERALGKPVRAHNAGVGGDITTQAIARLEKDVLARCPDLVTVMFGVNDAGFYRPDTDSFADAPRVTLTVFRRCMVGIVERIQKAGATVVLLTPLPMNEHYWGIHLEPYVRNGLNYLVTLYAQAVRDVAADRGVPLVDTYGHFLSHTETVDMVPDGIHPDPKGHRTIAELLCPVVLKAVKAR